MNIKAYSALMIALSSFIVGQPVVVAQSAPSSCQNSELKNLYDRAFSFAELYIEWGVAKNWEEYTKNIDIQGLIDEYNLNTEQKRSCWKLGTEDGFESFKSRDERWENWPQIN